MANRAFPNETPQVTLFVGTLDFTRHFGYATVRRRCDRGIGISGCIMFSKYFNLSRTVYILCVGTLVNRAGTFVIPFLTTYFHKELHWDEKSSTFATGVYGVGALAAMLIGGQLADRYGRKLMMMCALCGSATGLVIFSAVTATWAVMGALLLFAVVGEMYRPAASAMIADVTPIEQRPQAFALMYVAVNLGFAIATPLGGFISQRSFQAMFWLDAMTSAIYAVIILVAIRETLHLTRGGAAAATASKQPERLKSGSSDNILAATKFILTDRTFMLFWAATFSQCLLWMQAMSVLPLHLQQQGFTTQEYGWIIGVNGMLIVAVQLPVSAIVARYPRKYMVPLSSVVAATGFALTALAERGWQHGAAVAVWTCGEIMNAPLMSAIIGDLAPPHMRARYMGAFSMCWSLAMVVSPPIGGRILAEFGATTLWLGCGMLGLVSACLYAVATRANDPARPAAA